MRQSRSSTAYQAAAVNSERAGIAYETLVAYAEKKSPSAGNINHQSLQELVTDLLTDLCHLAS